MRSRLLGPALVVASALAVLLSATPNSSHPARRHRPSTRAAFARLLALSEPGSSAARLEAALRDRDPGFALTFGERTGTGTEDPAPPPSPTSGANSGASAGTTAGEFRHDGRDEHGGHRRDEFRNERGDQFRNLLGRRLGLLDRG